MISSLKQKQCQVGRLTSGRSSRFGWRRQVVGGAPVAGNAIRHVRFLVIGPATQNVRNHYYNPVKLGTKCCCFASNQWFPASGSFKWNWSPLFGKKVLGSSLNYRRTTATTVFLVWLRSPRRITTNHFDGLLHWMNVLRNWKKTRLYFQFSLYYSNNRRNLVVSQLYGAQRKSMRPTWRTRKLWRDWLRINHFDWQGSDFAENWTEPPGWKASFLFLLVSTIFGSGVQRRARRPDVDGKRRK